MTLEEANVIAAAKKLGAVWRNSLRSNEHGDPEWDFAAHMALDIALAALDGVEPAFPNLSIEGKLDGSPEWDSQA